MKDINYEALKFNYEKEELLYSCHNFSLYGEDYNSVSLDRMKEIVTKGKSRSLYDLAPSDDFVDFIFDFKEKNPEAFI